ncbi:MAG TPA: hypothetical protein ENK92_02960, partial [Bacteroidetes bacterium]|nr:hypothetical protein [Bacteroidota bacterium]
MKVAIIGTVVYDSVVHYNKELHSGFGGITFNVLAFGKLLRQTESKIYPISIIGKDRYKEFTELTQIYPNIRNQGIYPLKEH